MIASGLSTAQRVILILYCAVLVYCCLWIPWQSPLLTQGVQGVLRQGYGWLWIGPANPHSAYPSEFAARLAVPDVSVIILRLASVSALAAAAFLIAGIGSKTPRSDSEGLQPNKSAAPSAPSYPKLSEEAKDRVITDVARWQHEAPPSGGRPR